jgi:hypothetical protein
MIPARLYPADNSQGYKNIAHQKTLLQVFTPLHTPTPSRLNDMFPLVTTLLLEQTNKALKRVNLTMTFSPRR